MPEIDAGLVKLAPASSEMPIEPEGLSLADESVDLLLETSVLYPPPTAATDAEALTLAPIQAGGLLQTTLRQGPARPDAGVEGRQGGAIERPLNLNIGPAIPIPAPVIDGREARALNTVNEASLSAAVSLGLRERGQQGEPASRAAPITVTNPVLDPDDRGALMDLARRFDLAPAQRTESATDALQARFAAAQATQTSQGQVSPQPSQSTLSLSPAAAATTDLGYAAAAQLSTDLISTSVRDRAWGEQVGDRVVMMAANQLKQAEIRLSPAELGPLRVKVSVDDGNAHVTFHAQHAVTREALEQALPRLREMLAENGLSLGQADVSDRGVNDDGGERGSEGGALNSSTDDVTDIDLEMGVDSTRRATTSNGLVDTFA
jgi:flagellar hook-length control protein FliK